MNIQTVRSKSPFHLQPCVFGIQLVPLAIAAPHSAVNEVFLYLPPQHRWIFGVLKPEIAGLTAFTPPDCQIPPVPWKRRGWIGWHGGNIPGDAGAPARSAAAGGGLTGFNKLRAAVRALCVSSALR